MKKAEKVTFVENLQKELKGAKSVVLVNYAGLSVKAQQELKKRLAEVGGKMKQETSADGFGALSHYEDTTDTIKSQQEMAKRKETGSAYERHFGVYRRAILMTSRKGTSWARYREMLGKMSMSCRRRTKKTRATRKIGKNWRRSIRWRSLIGSSW